MHGGSKGTFLKRKFRESQNLKDFGKNIWYISFHPNAEFYFKAFLSGNCLTTLFEYFQK